MRLLIASLVVVAACAAPPGNDLAPENGGGEGEVGDGGEGEVAEGEGDVGDGGEGEVAEGEGEAGEGEGEVAEGEGEAGEGEGEGEDDVVDLRAAAVDVVQAGSRPGQVVDEALRLLLDVVLFASNAPDGGDGADVRTFGTVTQDAGGDASYGAAPADALVFSAPGVTARFEVDAFDGDFTVGDEREFYLHDHDVVASVVVTGADGDDFAFASHLANDAGSRSADGVSGGDAFSFDATVVVDADFGSGTVEYRSTEVRSGSVGDLDFTDDSAYHLVFFDNVAEDLVDTLTVTGTLAGSSWSLTDGLVQRTFRDGAAVEPDFWGGTTGELRRNGAPFGALAARDAGGAFEIVLVTGDPEDPDNVSVLETHPN
jgi:hypothetical protein